jgi:phosphonate transport system substrate-binding protein
MLRFPFRITIYYLLITLLAACNVPTRTPVAAGTEPLETASPASPVAGTEEEPPPTDVPTVVPELGEEGNPILLALPPAQIVSPETIASGQSLALQLEEQTGYRVVAVAPSSYTELIEAMRNGNAHIAGLPPYAIAKAYEQEAVKAIYASTQDEQASYGAQFIARGDQFESFYDPNAGRNFKDALEALSQFSGKKPCWTEPDSLSGYRVAAGILGWYKIPTQEGAFMQSPYSVVRAIQLGGVCDFGATYIDARDYPPLTDQFPNIMEDIIVVWQIPPVIPYNGLFLSPALPADVSAKLNAAFLQVSLNEEGKDLLESLYGIEAMIPVEDIFYTEFVRYIASSSADWDTLVH